MSQEKEETGTWNGGSQRETSEGEARTRPAVKAVGSPQSKQSAVPAQERDLVFLDCETTGLNPDVNEMIELSAVRIPARMIASPEPLPILDVTPDLEKSGCVASDRQAFPFMSARIRMVHPETAHPKALEVNGYTPEKWTNAVDGDLAFRAFVAFMFPSGQHEPIIVGQNTWFDWRFLMRLSRAGAVRQEMPETKYLLDTASMAWRNVARGIIEKPSLEMICNHHRVSNDGAHGSWADVRRTVAVYRAMIYGLTS